jgi:hypothetical protein
LGNVYIFVRSGPGVDPYFNLPMSAPPNGWQKVWFFLWNDADAPLPVFTGSRPVRQLNWGYGVAQKDLCRLQSLREVIQQLLQGWVTGVDLLRTFFRRCVQLLRQREMTLWMYTGPSCPNRPFSTHLDDTDINTQIWGILAYVANLDFGSGPVPLRERVKNPWVSPVELTFIYLCQFLLFKACTFLCRISGTHTVSRRGSPYLRMWRGGRPTVSTANDYG